MGHLQLFGQYIVGSIAYMADSPADIAFNISEIHITLSANIRNRRTFRCPRLYGSLSHSDVIE